MQYPHVIEQHAEMLPFLWSQRTALAHDETTAIADLNRFDLRLQGNQDGLRLAGQRAWPILEHTWSQLSPGVVFGRATVALAAGDMEQFAHLTVLPEARSPLVSALGFAGPGAAANALGLLAARDDLPSRQIAARGHRALRLTAGLASLISDPDPSVQGPAIEAAGLARSLDEAALSALHHATRAGGFGPHWALWLISRDPTHLEAMLEMPDVDPARAALAARLASPSLLAGWLSAHQRRSPALAIELTAALGLVEHLGWLGEVLEDPRYCAQAARALRRITGAPPDLPVESESADTGRELRAWVEANAGRFARQERYLAGAHITPRTIRAQLNHGKQGVRLQAAFEAAAWVGTREPILNTHGPAFRQLAALRSWNLEEG
jgi:hypothetical protein